MLHLLIESSLIMANYFFKNSINVMLLFWPSSILSIFSPVMPSSSKLEAHGWIVPPANDSKIYSDLASVNRFQVGDTIRFKYKKDSVMEVTNENYKKCNSTHPYFFFSNTGDSVFGLDHSGDFYFISGVSGHCEKGQRMIIKVMSDNDSSPGDHGQKSSSAQPAAVLTLRVSKQAIVQLVLLRSLASYLY